MSEESQNPQGLELLRQPFPENQIGKLAKGSKAQTQCDAKEKKNCTICGGWHHPQMIHIDYVGHAALTDRLLDADPLWTWEPFTVTSEGLPAFDASGGLWIRLTVCGHTRIGYGNAEPSQYKEVGSREKEVIGDALRNAAMRFGAALELWHKGDLRPDKETLPPPSKDKPKAATKAKQAINIVQVKKEIYSINSITELNAWYTNNRNRWDNEADKQIVDFCKCRKQEIVASINQDLDPPSRLCPNKDGAKVYADYCETDCKSRTGCPAWE